MQVTLIGDVHNNSCWTNSQYLPPNSIQIGDFHDVSYKEWEENNSTRPHGWQNEKRFFIEGNHDFYPDLKLDHPEPYEVAKGLYHIPRGFISGAVLFIGGAYSYIRPHSTMPWFPEHEQISNEQFVALKKRLEGEYIHTVVAHDLPAFIHPHLGLYDRPAEHNFRLWEIYNMVRPVRWIAGHHHKDFEMRIDKCYFHIINIARKQTFDLPIDPSLFE